MSFSNRQFAVWVVVSLMLSIVFAIGATTETSGSKARSVRLDAGWSAVTGELINIKCADPEPVKIERRGIPFAHQETEFICSGENEVQASRSNTLALLLNVAVAAGIAALGIGLSGHVRRRAQKPY